jgi:predicted nucleic acid-binding protein
MKVVLLDAGPLGLVTNPKMSLEAAQSNQWLKTLLSNHIRVLVPEIADYEVRRELLRGGKTKGVQRLDALKATIGYLPITTEAMLLAAQNWAEARRAGQPTADDKALDADVILAAGSQLLVRQGDEVVVATTNVGHLARFASAKNWGEILP